jgi:L-aspartate oxidase
MSADAGVIRSEGSLQSLLDWIDGQIASLGAASPLVAARLVALAALQRRESRGGHWRADYPVERKARRTFVGPDGQLLEAAQR